MNETVKTRRRLVSERIGNNAALILAATPEIMVGRDTELRYVVDAELFYLTGYTEPEAVLVIVPSHDSAHYTMFVRPRDQAREIWTGARGGEAMALERFGADAAFSIDELATRLPELLASVDVIYARTGAGRPDVDAVLQQTLANARRARSKTGHGAHTLIDPGVVLDDMRVVKSAHEIDLMREAARISCDSFRDTLTRVRSGIGEWEVEAWIEFGFRSRGADGPAFPTIAASGANATVLHYVENRAVALEGDLLLLDAGARYQMYCADITRTVPVSGKFTEFQRALYDVVLAAHDAAIEATCPGASADAPHEAAQRVLAEGLQQLGIVKGDVDSIIEDENGLRRYFPHRTIHWLGLEVHDVGQYASPEGPVRLLPGMVMTIEPGLYMPERGIGIRIEDDVLVTPTGQQVLTSRVPVDPDEIEALVQSGTA